MKPAAVYDIETEDWTMFVAGGIQYADGTYEAFHWQNEDEFVDAILAVEGEVYAHNGGRFDHLWLLDHVRKRNLNARVSLAGGSIVCANIGKTKLLDSWRLFPMSLRELTKGAKVSKAELSLPCVCGCNCGGYCSIKRRMPKKYRDQMMEYLEKDCVSLFESLLFMGSFANEARINLGITCGSSAWKTVSEELNIPDCELGRGDFDFVRAGYYGGRCQLFKDNAKTGYQYDVNSMYPGALANFAVPVGTGQRVRGTRAKSAFAEKRPGIYRAIVRVPNMHIPPLPLRCKMRTAYPVGKFEGIWTIPELLYAESLGTDVYPMEAFVYQDEQILFTNWINRLFDLRMKYGKDTRQGKWLKLVMNSLTGKFGSRPEKERILINPLGDDMSACECELNTPCRCGKPMPLTDDVFKSQYASIDACAHPEFAGYLTAQSRIELHKQLISKGGADVLYCDTDSCFSEIPHTHRIGNKLGEWAFEGRFKNFVGHAPKVYKLEPEGGALKLRAKGITIKNQTMEEWNKIIEGEGMKREGPAGLKSRLHAETFFAKSMLVRHIGKGFGDRKAAGMLGETRPPNVNECKIETIKL